MRILTLLILVLAGCAITPPARTSPGSGAAEVVAVVTALFDAMREADGDAAARLFHPQARLESVGRRDGEVVLRSDPADDFVRAIGTPRDEVWDERIWNVEVRIDDALATAWMDYAFFRGDEYSHCGVNAFTLVRVREGWRITHIVDTRRTEGCEPPAR
jgi:hypothetical protein